MTRRTKPGPTLTVELWMRREDGTPVLVAASPNDSLWLEVLARILENLTPEELQTAALELLAPQPKTPSTS